VQASARPAQWQGSACWYVKFRLNATTDWSFVVLGYVYYKAKSKNLVDYAATIARKACSREDLTEVVDNLILGDYIIAKNGDKIAVGAYGIIERKNGSEHEVRVIILSSFAIVLTLRKVLGWSTGWMFGKGIEQTPKPFHNVSEDGIRARTPRALEVASAKKNERFRDHTTICKFSYLNLEVYHWIILKDIVCGVNIQHDCSYSKCSDYASQTILQDKVETSRIRSIISHNNVNQFILNTYSLHNYASITAVIPNNIRPNLLCKPLSAEEAAILRVKAAVQVRNQKHEEEEEKARKQMEQEQKKAEKEQKKVEKERKKAERERVKADKERAKAEKERAKAEKERMLVEQAERIQCASIPRSMDLPASNKTQSDSTAARMPEPTASSSCPQDFQMLEAIATSNIVRPRPVKKRKIVSKFSKWPYQG
jgi:hypothetical protein